MEYREQYPKLHPAKHNLKTINPFNAALKLIVNDVDRHIILNEEYIQHHWQ